MNHLKEFCKRPEENIEFFLTYADNFAIVFFKKQGFKMPVTMPRERWAPFIKDYEGGTLMECYINPRIEYVRRLLASVCFCNSLVRNLHFG